MKDHQKSPERYAIDFSKPVPVTTLARLAGINAACLQSRDRRRRAGLVDTEAPPLGRRFRWVTGESAYAFLEAVRQVNYALHPRQN